tara:strand:- start:235 stop:1170 length:936 start_codon:yes stop_codon:yes gene_type:complete
MPFLGRGQATGKNTVLLDAITASATATYNLTLGSVAYTPIAAPSLVVSLNGVTQAPISGYTVSGSQIVFASALTSNDVIDYIIGFEAVSKAIPNNGVTTEKIVDGAVTSAKIADATIVTADIADDAVTGAKLANNIDIAGTLDVTGLLTADASVSVTGNVDILAQGDLRLQDSAGGQYVAMQAPATIGSSYTLTLPADDGDANQVLATNGSGVLDWVTSGGLYDAWSIITSATNLASGGQYISNSSSALTHTLPSGSAGSTVTIKNNGSGLVTIARTSSQKINGAAADATMPQGNAAQLVYVDSTTGWLVL